MDTMDEIFSVPGIDYESKVFNMLWEIGYDTTQKIGKPLANDFACKPEDLPVWLKAVDFNHETFLPSGLGVSGFRFLNFKDCTNCYVLNRWGETTPFHELDKADQNCLLDYMEEFVEFRKKELGYLKKFDENGIKYPRDFYIVNDEYNQRHIVIPNESPDDTYVQLCRWRLGFVDRFDSMAKREIARSRSKDFMSQLREQEAASEQRAQEKRKKKGYRKFHR